MKKTIGSLIILSSSFFISSALAATFQVENTSNNTYICALSKYNGNIGKGSVYKPTTLPNGTVTDQSGNYEIEFFKIENTGNSACGEGDAIGQIVKLDYVVSNGSLTMQNQPTNSAGFHFDNIPAINKPTSAYDANMVVNYSDNN